LPFFLKSSRVILGFFYVYNLQRFKRKTTPWSMQRLASWRI